MKKQDLMQNDLIANDGLKILEILGLNIEDLKAETWIDLCNHIKQINFNN